MKQNIVITSAKREKTQFLRSISLKRTDCIIKNLNSSRTKWSFSCAHNHSTFSSSHFSEPSERDWQQLKVILRWILWRAHPLMCRATIHVSVCIQSLTHSRSSHKSIIKIVLHESTRAREQKTPLVRRMHAEKWRESGVECVEQKIKIKVKHIRSMGYKMKTCDYKIYGGL